MCLLNLHSKHYMMKRPLNILFIIMTAILSDAAMQAQQTGTEEIFKPYGEPFARIFTNFHMQMGGEHESAFSVDRAYLGYNYFPAPGFSAFVKLDIGSPNDVSEYSKLRRYAYFKNAGFQYNHGRLTWRFGLIDTRQFSLQEKIWAHRYIMKSYQDQYKFGPKADLGTTVLWDFSPAFSMDISLMNGEGYKQLQLDNAFKSAIGFTYTPDKFIFRIYGDVIIKNEKETNFSAFGAWKNEKMQYGIEVVYRYNDNFVRGHDMWGGSVNGLYRISDKFEIFARYDYLTSNPVELPDAGWNYNHDGSALIGGIQYRPVKPFKVALNYQDWYPWPKNYPNETFLFLNFEVEL